jgi:catechol 2,3-dioxygenase-like lactoylglutathione lyase family enzyme
MTDAPRLKLLGVHHVTLICGDLERSTRFYRDVLGLTLVREAASDDDPDARHFWFGDPDARPGTLVSLMEYPDLEEGRQGRGSTHHLAFHVGSRKEVDAWADWLRSQGVDTTETYERGGLRSTYFRDPDGHVLEIATAS